MIFFFIVLTLSIIIGKHIYDLHQFNHLADLKQIQNPNHFEIKELIKSKSPLLIHNLIGKYDLTEFTLDSLINNNPGYIIDDNGKNISLSSFRDYENIYILNNKPIVNHIGYKGHLDEIHNSFSDKLSCNITHEISIQKGQHFLPLIMNKHNCEYYTQLNGESIFFIFNPKHGNDIKDKQNQEIKKWAFKINLKTGLTIYIPPGWYYFYESNDISIIGHSYSDNYFTWFYNNYLR